MSGPIYGQGRGRVRSGFALGLLVGGGIFAVGVLAVALFFVAWFTW